MSNLDDLINYYKQKAKQLRIKAEISKYFVEEDSEQLELSADENELLAIILTNYNQLLEYDEINMTYKLGNIEVIQSTTIQIPMSKSSSSITVIDLNAEEEIDYIELVHPLTKKEFIYFAKQYVNKL